MFYIFCLLVLNLASVQSMKSHSYSLQKNVNVIATPWLFAKTISKMSCISKCNLEDNCLSVVYSTESLKTSNNCFLYTKYFDVNEFFTSENTYLYIRKCKIHFKIVFPKNIIYFILKRSFKLRSC